MVWQASESKSVAHTLHVAALAGYWGAAYRRRDEKLRRAAGVGPYTPSVSVEELRVVLRQAAAQGLSAWEEHDRRWFDKRWSLGESRAASEHSQELVTELRNLGLNALFSNPVQVQSSAAIGASPVAIREPHFVAAAPQACAKAVLVATLGVSVLELLPPTTLSEDDRRWQAEFIACSLVRARLGEAAFSDWLGPLMTNLLGNFAKASSVEVRVRRIAEASLDQAPGEIERIGVGLGRRLKSRLDRALRRSFFTPESPRLAHWFEARVTHREPA